MQTRLDCAEQHAPEIGLILQTSIEDKRLEHFDEITVSRPAVPSILKEGPFLRHNRADDTAVATSELCQPVAIGVFGFTEETAMGQSAHLADCTCLEAQPSGTTTTTAFPGQGITGTTFRDAKPDLIFKYTAIHELGHTFGLCHVNNLLRIMYTPAEARRRAGLPGAHFGSCIHRARKQASSWMKEKKCGTTSSRTSRQSAWRPDNSKSAKRRLALRAAEEV